MKLVQLMKHCLLAIFLFTGLASISAQHSVAREWNEVLLGAIRNDFARPTIHARNLFHSSTLMYDCWAAYDTIAQPFFLGKSIGGFDCPFDGVPVPTDIHAAREEAMSYAMFRLLNHRFLGSPGGQATLNSFSSLFTSLGYDPSNASEDYQSGEPAALGNYIAARMIEFGLQDGSNEQSDYANAFYSPVNGPLVTNFPGNPDIIDANRWQPLTLDVFIDQSGNELPFNTPPFLSPEWGQVVPFALTDEDLVLHERNGNTYWTYHDPGPPPYLDPTTGGGLSDEYKWNFSLVSIWSSHLDPTSPTDVQIDISPATIGNIQVDQYPTTITGLRDFYNLTEGGDVSLGHALNPTTGEAYAPQIVSRADYGRVLAEFWADGPDSETPPGHWFTLLNYVNDHPDFEKRYRGQGEILDDLEWDVKAYFMMGGAVHDAAIAAWGAKGWYDYIRPISAIRAMADLGQSSSDTLPSYHPGGIQLVENYIELVDSADALAGPNFANVGKIKVYAWRGPDYIINPAFQFAGVDWILAENWWPYQRPSFVTPPFAGYVSGHSTFSRAAAEIMTALTGDPFFPGGMGEFVAPQNDFLVFERGPSTDIVLQWATYRDASDQCSLSRIWGGIHPPADDIPGRLMGIEIGQDAFKLAETYFFIDADNDGFFAFEDCDDDNEFVNANALEICDGIDNNCNGLIDEDITIFTYFADVDNDGFGDFNVALDTCAATPPAGFVTNSQDCDDDNEFINANAVEICDGIDNNCNGLIDEDITIFTYFADVDNDGFGDFNVALDTCAAMPPAGFVTNSQDCDDDNEFINANAVEICDGIDNNCNGLIDEDITVFTYFADVDNDGFGDFNVALDTCAAMPPAGFVTNSQDCDDDNEFINANAVEICDGIDNNCNGLIDEDITVFTYFADVDNDGFGDFNVALDTCAAMPPAGFVTNNEDCDDDNEFINPDAEEVANNGIDEDCADGDLISSVRENSFGERIDLFPNPFTDQLTIRSTYEGELIIQILSSEGKLISANTLRLENGNLSIDFTSVPSGIYFVSISNPAGTRRQFEKVFKQ